MKENSRKFLEKADRTLKAAEMLLREGDLESAAGRCYYAMLHTAQALLTERDLGYRKYSAVHSALGEHFAKPGIVDPKFHRWLLDTFDERLKGDYDIDVSFETDSVQRRIAQAREFIGAARAVLKDGA